MYKTIFTALLILFVFAPPASAQSRGLADHADPYASLNCVQLSDSIVAVIENAGMDPPSTAERNTTAVRSRLSDCAPDFRRRLRDILRGLLDVRAERIRLRNPVEPIAPAPAARPEPVSDCNVAVFKTSDLLGSVAVEGVMETWQPGDWMYAQLYDGDKWLGNGMTTIDPGGGFSFLVTHARLPAKAELKYRCAPF